MSTDYRLFRCLVCGFEYDEAAEVIGCRIGTVKSRLSRAREHFAAKLRAHMRAPQSHETRQAE